MTQRDGTNKFYIFGGRAEDGSLLNDLWCFDMEEEAWNKPQILQSRTGTLAPGQADQLPAPREGHASCFVADRYLVVYGGIDADGLLVDEAAVYDIHSCTWIKVGKVWDEREKSDDKWAKAGNIPPRAFHRIVDRGGVMYVMGGITAGANNPKDLRPTEPPEPASLVPLSSQVFPFAQKSSFDFLGNSSQAILVKPSNSLTNLRNTFTVEAVFSARTCQVAQNPVIVKTDNGLKTGFGMLCQEHPAFKGDAEEGSWVHFFVGQWTTGMHQMVSARLENPGQWTHAVATFNGSEIRMYINGSLKESKEWVVTEEEAETLHSKGDLMIGGMPGKYAFDGFIDECRVWDVCRDEEEVKKHMNVPCTDPNTRNCIGQWTFNEGAGDIVIDSSGSRNHATFERYAGGVELRRVQSRRPILEKIRSEREKHIDAQFDKLQAWKADFLERNKREATKSEMMSLVMTDPEMHTLATRLGEFGID